jgi:hypothetical protein
MARLENLTRGVQVKGVRNDGPVEVVDVEWYGTGAIELTLRDTQGRPGNDLLLRPTRAGSVCLWPLAELQRFQALRNLAMNPAAQPLSARRGS